MSARSLVLPVLGVPRLSAQEDDLLRRVVGSGSAFVAASGRAPVPPEAGGERAARFLYRRWVLEILLLLRARGSLGFNELARALGRLAGESLAPKLASLVVSGVIERVPTSDGSRRVLYRLTAEGLDLGSGAFALTSGKAEHARALQQPGSGFGLLAALRAEGADPHAALVGYQAGCREFAAARLARAPEADLDACLDAARRFSATCVHRWHGDVLARLALGGPARFADLRRSLGAGDQALSVAVRGLERLRSVERLRDARWAVTEPGRFDLALGMPLLALLPPSALQPG